jgi:cytochrome c biogenesis protein ResB
VVWQDWNGCAGVQFVDVPKSSRRLLNEFLSASLSADAAEDRFEDVTVQVEEPLQLATVSVSEQTHGTQKTQTVVHETSPQESAASGHTDADNRRAQVRYACRLGAEVYRTGTSVPNHCCLTDLSAGGCYLEVPLPFPQGSSVEILVRTYEMKLRLRGAVLASHPGYGMGVAFELKTKEERENVKKLTDYVATTTSPS